MSIFSCKLKLFIQTVLALLFTAVILCFYIVTNSCRLTALDGERTFYLQSASSQGLRRETLTLRDLPFIRGESVRFDIHKEFVEGKEATQETAGAEEPMLTADFIAERIASEYGAVILFTEEVAGVRSYYGYTARWTDGVMIYGKKVNLHIALSLDMSRGAVGSPIIFDGY